MVRTQSGLLLALVLAGCGTREHDEREPHVASAAPTFAVGSRRAIAVELATAADRPFHVLDRESGVGASVRLRGGLAGALAETSARGVVFRAGYRGKFDVEQRQVAAGLEDFIRFDTAPTANEVDYDLSLDAGVAGLRLIGNILELVDAQGVPRLRMAPPWIQGSGLASDGARVDVDVEIRGCAVDRDAGLPWEHPPVSPGARMCGVHLSWGKVTYPALLDPSWVSTDSAAVGHNNGATVAFPNGNVLLVGGCVNGNTLTRVAEIYGATTGVFASTTQLPAARANHTATALTDGSVLVAGGDSATSGICFSGSSFTSGAVRLSGTTWTASTLGTNRATHGASRLANGKVLIAGGRGTSGQLSSAELYDPATNTWTSAGSMATAHSQPGQVTLTTGDVLVAGGYSDTNLVSKDTALFDATALTWSAVGQMPNARAFLTMVALPGGTAVVAGGRETASAPPPYPADTLRWAPSTKTWAAGAPLPSPRQNMGGILLPNGDVLFIGGTNVLSSSSYTTSARVDLLTAAGAFETFPSLATSRATPGVALFGAAHDRVIVMGGIQVGAVLVTAQTLTANASVGTSCTKESDCAPTLACVASKCATPISDAGASDAGVDAQADGAADSTVTDSGGPDTKADAAADTATDTVTDTADTKPVDAGAALGASCSAASACASGYCVDGVCCDSPCTSRCLACAAAKKTSGLDGVCEPALVDVVDPRALCADEGAPSCGTNGRCDGVGGCAWYAPGTNCAPASACDGTGACVANDAGIDAATADASIDAADTTTTDTATTDTTAADTTIADTSAPDTGPEASFTPVEPNATPLVGSGLAIACKIDGDCTSGHCAQGVCCDRACEGECESCALSGSPGRCELVPLGRDPKQACSAVPCLRTCGGAGACVSAFVGAECSRQRCTSPSTGEGPTACTAVGGACPPAVAFDCGAFACDPAFGACLRDCHTSNDCAPGRVCEVASRNCVDAPPSDDSGGCVMGSPHGSKAPSSLVLLGLVVLAGLRRRSPGARGPVS